MKVIVAILTLLAIVIDGRQAFAYIDPTASGTMIQILLAGGTGVLIFAQQVWKRIRARKSKPGDRVEEGSHGAPDPGNAKDNSE